MNKPKLHIIPHHHKVNQLAREKLNGHRAILLWFTGLSGSGKSTIANAVEQELYTSGKRTYLLDGDNVRKGLNSDLDFSKSGRNENIRRIGEVSDLFLDSGAIVLAAFISPFISNREKVRETVGRDRMLEIFVDCPLEVCEKRDVKGLYQKARNGEIPNFTGINSPFESPVDPDIHLRTDTQDLNQCVQEVIKLTLEKIKL